MTTEPIDISDEVYDDAKCSICWLSYSECKCDEDDDLDNDDE